MLSLGACAASPEVQQKMAIYRSTIPTCENEEDCRQKWEAAQVFVVRNSGYRIQTATDVLIQTFGPMGSTTALAMQVIKEPLGNGRYRISITTSCDNIFGCYPDAWDTAILFNRTVGTSGFVSLSLRSPIQSQPSGPLVPPPADAAVSGNVVTIARGSVICASASTYNQAVEAQNAAAPGNTPSYGDQCYVLGDEGRAFEFVRTSAGATIIRRAGQELYTANENVQ